MKINEDLQTIVKKAFSDAGTYVKPESMETISSSLSSLTKESEIEEEPIIKRTIKKSEISNLLGKKKSNMKLPIGKLTSIGKTNENEIKMTKKEMLESWSKKYKKSIDCENPKGFSQKAHCQGKKKKTETKEATGAGSAGGFLAPVGFNPQSKFVKDSFKETPKKIEAKEATGASSSGSYETPAAWAKSTSKKDWRGKSKTLFPGGAFVQVKKKCKTFPYCNQGDINALNITKPKSKKINELDNIIKELSIKHNISENLVRKILNTELGNIN